MHVESISGKKALVANQVNFKYHVFITLAKEGPFNDYQMADIKEHVEKARRWCNQNARGRWFVQRGWAGESDDFNRYVVASFDDEHDAFIFKLTN